MIRILAGEKKGQQLKTPRGKSVRPTAANVRRVLFDILGADTVDCRWLDLFAGSGAVGLEALSRGAAKCVLVENARASIAVARQNIHRLNYTERCELLDVRAEKALRQLTTSGRVFDIIFLDPPYHGNEATHCLLALGETQASSLLASRESLVIAQVSSRIDICPKYGVLGLERERLLGDTRLCFFRAAGEKIPKAANGGAKITDGSTG